MRPTIRFEGLTTFRKRMEFLAKLQGKTANEELLTQARGFVREIIRITPPAQGSASVRKNQSIGEHAVARDVGRVYLSAGRAYNHIRDVLGEPQAKAFWAAYQSGNKPVAESLLRRAGGLSARVSLGPFDGGAHHARNRNNRGRVSRDRHELVPTPGPEYEAYMNRKIGNVGILASGWVASARLVGERAPAYASRHSGNGAAHVTRKRSGDIYTFHNRVPYATQADLRRRADLVLAKQRRKLVERIRRTVRHVARRAA